MAWLKVDDQMFSNRKAVQAFTSEPAALGVWLMCATWSANQMTDGFIPSFLLRMWSVDEALVQVLVEVGLWTADPVEEGHWMKDFLDYNPSRAELEEKREKDAARRASARTRSGRTADASRPVPVPGPVTSLRDVTSAARLSAKEIRTRQRLGIEPTGGNAA